MTKLALRRILAAALLLFIPLVATTASAADVKGALKFVPRDSFAVGVSNFDKIKKSQIYKRIKQLATKDKSAKRELAKLKRETGIDIFRDIRSVVVALGPQIDRDDDQWVVIAEAAISEARLIAFMKKEGANVQKETGPSGKYYSIDNQGALAFRGKFVIVGGIAMVKQALRKKGPKQSLKSALALYNKRDVFVAAEPTRRHKKMLKREHKDLGAKLIAGGLNVRKGMDLDVFAKLATAAAAKNIAALVNSVLDEGKKDPTARKMGLVKYIKRIKIAAVGAKLTGKMKLTSAEVKSLMKTLEKLL